MPRRWRRLRPGRSRKPSPRTTTPTTCVHISPQRTECSSRARNSQIRMSSPSSRRLAANWSHMPRSGASNLLRRSPTAHRSSYIASTSTTGPRHGPGRDAHRGGPVGCDRARWSPSVARGVGAQPSRNRLLQEVGVHRRGKHPLHGRPRPADRSCHGCGSVAHITGELQMIRYVGYSCMA